MTVRCRFVDKIDASPTVRLDLNADPWILSRPGTEFPPPALRRAVADSGVLRDGSLIPASAYDNRMVRLALVVDTDSQDLLATQLQSLHRELDRAANILEYRSEGMTNSVFFRTFRSPDYDADYSYPSHDSRITLNLVAEPFALGVRSDIAAVTVRMNPTDTNGHYWDISGVTGDVPTPAFIKDETTGAWKGYVFGIRSHGTPSDMTFFVQAEDMTSGTDTSNPGGGPDAAMSGAGTNNYQRTTFATDATMRDRVIYNAGVMSDAAGVAFRGRYRVFARIRRSSATGTIKVQLSYDAGGTNSSVTTALTTTPGWIDMGLVTFGATVTTPGYGVTAPIRMDDLRFKAERTSGTSTLDWDYVLFVPADTALQTVDMGQGFSARDIAFDSINEAVYTLEDAGSPFDGGTYIFDDADRIQIAGGWMVLAPNQTNRIVTIFGSTVDGATIYEAAGIGQTTDFVVSYWPRWLYIRP